MTDFRKRRTEFAERQSGFRIGQRVRLSARGCKHIRKRTHQKNADDLGTIVDLLTAMTARIKWDRFKRPECLSVDFIAPAEPDTHHPAPEDPTQQGDQS